MRAWLNITADEMDKPLMSVAQFWNIILASEVVDFLITRGIDVFMAHAEMFAEIKPAASAAASLYH